MIGTDVSELEEQKEYTFSMYPQEGTNGPPIAEYMALKKPLRCAIVMSFGCDIVIYGWI